MERFLSEILHGLTSQIQSRNVSLCPQLHGHIRIAKAHIGVVQSIDLSSRGIDVILVSHWAGHIKIFHLRVENVMPVINGQVIFNTAMRSL